MMAQKEISKRVKKCIKKISRLNIRKRVWKYFISTKQQIGETIRKFNGKKEKLEILAWEMPIKKISEIYNVAPSTISYWFKKWNILVPPKGYWLQH